MPTIIVPKTIIDHPPPKVNSFLKGLAKMAQPKCVEYAPIGYRRIYVRHIRHWKTGRIIFPKKGQCFSFLVPVNS